MNPQRSIVTRTSYFPKRGRRSLRGLGCSPAGEFERHMIISDFECQCCSTHADFVLWPDGAVEAVRDGLIKLPVPINASFVMIENVGRRQLALRIPHDGPYWKTESITHLCYVLKNRINSRRSYKERVRLLEQQTSFHMEADLEVLWRLQKGLCYYTGERLGAKFSDRSFSVDHRTSLARGGDDGPLNLVLALKKVNSLKKAMSAPDFFRFIKASKEVRAAARAIDRLRRGHFKDVDRKK